MWKLHVYIRKGYMQQNKCSAMCGFSAKMCSKQQSRQWAVLHYLFWHGIGSGVELTKHCVGLATACLAVCKDA